jgi:hypothetical protein
MYRSDPLGLVPRVNQIGKLLRPGEKGTFRSSLEGVWSPGVEWRYAKDRKSIERGTPFGGESWQQTTADRLGLESSLRPGGRPSSNA